VASLAGELTEAKAQRDEKAPVVPGDVMPLTVWRCPEFEPALAEKVEKVALNSLLQPASKLNQIYKLIIRFYADQLAKAEAQSRALIEETERAKGIVNQCAVDTSILLSLAPITYDDFVNRGGANKIVQQVTYLVHQLNDMSRVAQEYSTFADHFQAVFGKTPDLFTSCTELKETIDRLELKLRGKRKKNSELRNRLRDLAISSDQQTDELSRDNAALKETIVDLERTVAELNDTVKGVKKDLSSARQQLKEAQAAASDAEASISQDHQTLLDRLRSDHATLESQLNEHISALNTQVATASETIEENETTIAKLQNQLRTLQRSLDEKLEQFAELQQAKAFEIRQLSASAKSEKENLVQSYEAALSELTKQCDTRRNDLATVSRDFAESEAANRKAKAVIVALKRERLQLQTKLESLTTKSQRDSEVTRAIIRNTELTAESTVTQKLQDAKAHYESERRRIFSIAADEFRGYFNAADSIDERSFRQLLARVKGELRRLSDTDVVVRRLVGASPKQSTDDAVARLIT
jgi:chromosome segregation ATPase